MRPEGTIIAERAAARHCAELFGARQAPVDCAATLTALGDRIGRFLAAELAGLTGMEPTTVRSEEAHECAMSAMATEAQGPGLHSLIGIGADAAPLLASVDALPLLCLLDRALGGSGTPPDPLPRTLPLSAELFAARLEALLVRALAGAIGELHGDAPRPPVSPLRRDDSLARIAPFAGDAALWQLRLRIEEANGLGWAVTMAMPPATVAAILASPSAATSLKSTTPALDAEPFASLPITLCAIIVEAAIGVSRLAALKPGDVIPVAVARSVPIRAGGRTIAHGTIGELDDRVAVQINHIS